MKKINQFNNFSFLDWQNKIFFWRVFSFFKLAFCDVNKLVDNVK